MSGFNEFRERMKADAAFAGKVRECRNYDELFEFAEAQGFAFSGEEIEVLTDLTPEDLRMVSGGVNMSMRVLASGKTVLITDKSG